MIQTTIRNLHIELTNRCNAGCPLCGRTSNRLSGVAEFIENSGWIDLQLETLKKIPWENMNRVNFCGNYGDPMFAKDVVRDIYIVVYVCSVKISG